MFASQVLIFVLAFGVFFTNALPLHPHHRRDSCRSHKSIHVSATASSAAAGPAATPKQLAVGHAPATPSLSESDDDTSTSVPKSTESSTSTPKSTKSLGADALPSPTPKPKTTPAGGSSLLDALFPVADISDSWTTSTAAKDPRPLSDATFRVTKALRGLSRSYVPAPDGKMSLKAHFPAGSYNFKNEPKGGMSFYAPGPTDVDLKTAREATLGYSVFFENGFQFVKGGKLPGFYGGNSEEEAAGCSGGRRSNACFSTRLMWRGQGAGELYTYLPTNPANDKQCNATPGSHCNPKFGASVGRGAFKFPTGKWMAVAERIRLNTIGKADGEMELFVNGQSVINVKGLVLRESESSKFRGIMMQTFFGGSTPDFASPKDQNIFFSDFSVAITETF